MAQSSNKQRRSIKIAPGEQTKLWRALGEIEAHIGIAADIWHQLTPDQQTELRANSPILNRFLELKERF